jgi:hypothetical protein
MIKSNADIRDPMRSTSKTDFASDLEKGGWHVDGGLHLVAPCERSTK